MMLLRPTSWSLYHRILHQNELLAFLYRTLSLSPTAITQNRVTLAQNYATFAQNQATLAQN